MHEALGPGSTTTSARPHGSAIAGKSKGRPVLGCTGTIFNAEMVPGTGRIKPSSLEMEQESPHSGHTLTGQDGERLEQAECDLRELRIGKLFRRIGGSVVVPIAVETRSR